MAGAERKNKQNVLQMQGGKGNMAPNRGKTGSGKAQVSKVACPGGGPYSSGTLDSYP